MQFHIILGISRQLVFIIFILLLSSTFCNFVLVCNEVPEHPCVSPLSNQVFERRLIEKYIAENGTDPMNGQPLSEEQLVDIKGKLQGVAAYTVYREFWSLPTG